MTPEQTVAEAVRGICDHGPIRRLAVANAALDAIRDAIASGDPAVVQAMAERIGLAAERKADTPTVDAGHGTDCTSEVCVWWPEPHGHVRVTRDRFVTPWREVPDADA